MWLSEEEQSEAIPILLNSSVLSHTLPTDTHLFDPARLVTHAHGAPAAAPLSWVLFVLDESN